MRLPRSVIDNYPAGVNGISEQARSALADVLAQTDLTGDVAEVRATVSAAMQRICGASADAAAELSAAVYDGIRAVELHEQLGNFATDPSEYYEPDATDGAVRAFADDLVNEDYDAFAQKCADRVDYEVKVAAGKAMVSRAKHDGSRPRFARVPSGRETCPFCLMLASRGFVYRTEVAASHAHANCDCRIIPGWPGTSVAGYDPAALYNEWQQSIDDKAAERAERNGTSVEHERDHIMAAYARSGGGRHYERAIRPEGKPNFMNDEKSAKQRRVLAGKMSKEAKGAQDKYEVMRAIAKFDYAWKQHAHSVDEDNKWANRVNRLMVEHGITLGDFVQYNPAPAEFMYKPK